VNGEPSAAIVAVVTDGSGGVNVTPLFVAVTPKMRLEDHDGLEPGPLRREEMTFAEFNPDCMEREELLAFWQLTNRMRPIAEARRFFGGPPYKHHYVRVFKDLGSYASNKATAMGLRADGQIERAQEYERICERIYQNLPEWARW
jgi:hypothetical protein